MNQTTLTGHKDGFEEMEAYTIRKIKKVKDRVKYILECYPSSRGNDSVLLYRYFQVFGSGAKFTIRQFKDLLTMVAPETITRARRLIQNKEGLYLPKERTVRKRVRREQIIRDGINGV